MNMVLCLRLVGGQAPFRRRVQAWAGKVRIVQGERPEPVLAWRKEVMGRFRRRVKLALNTNAAEVRRLHAWDACFTGNGRGEYPEYYHSPWCAAEIKTPTMLDAAGPSPNGVLLAGFKSRVQPSPNGVLLAGFKSRVQRWVGGASQPAFLKVVLCFR